MTQKIFDTDNAEDMALLWSILPDDFTSIYQKKESVTSISNWVQRDNKTAYPLNFISLCWHDKTEITRPIPEVSEQDIGKICVFWNDETLYYGKLACICNQGLNTYYELDTHLYEVPAYKHCRRLTKQEIEELC